jgi:1,2-diacylglycerol 3-alpha-glucosyltransferase
MKILITSDWYYPVVNGVVRSILNLKKYLEESGHEVRVLTLSNSSESYKAQDIYYIGSLGAGKIYPEARFSPKIANKYIKEILDRGPDIVHSQCEFSSFMMAKKIASKLEIPIIHTYHTIYEDYTHYFSPFKKMGKKIMSMLSKAVADRVDAVIAPTNKTKNLLLNYKIEEEKIRVIATGIQIPRLMDKDKLREIHGYREDENIILYLGRMGVEKNIEELIDYYNRLELENTRFLIVGGGPYLEKLKKFAKDYPKEIEFVGMIEPQLVNEYYQMADIFVSASQSETQGLTYYEALSNKLIAICRKDSCLDGVIKDGFNGYQYSNFDEFSNYIKECIENVEKREIMQKNAREYAVKNFSIDSFGKRCQEEYQKLVEKKMEEKLEYKKVKS